MAKLIFNTILFVSFISALYGAPQNPTSARNEHFAPAISTFDSKPINQNYTAPSSEDNKTNIRPARAPHHDGTDHDHSDEHQSALGTPKKEEHIDHGSSTTPKIRPARAADEHEKHDIKNEHVPASLTKEQDQKQSSTSPKPRTARAAEKDEKHEDSHNHPGTLTKDALPLNHKQEATTGAQPARPARATEEEKKGAVHDQPIPVPSTLHTSEDKQDTKHGEVIKETPKHKRGTEDEDSDEDEHSGEDEHKSHPESDDHHPLFLHKELVVPKHEIQISKHEDSSSSEENKSKSS